jgi:hypothetical protein
MEAMRTARLRLRRRKRQLQMIDNPIHNGILRDEGDDHRGHAQGQPDEKKRQEPADPFLLRDLEDAQGGHEIALRGDEDVGLHPKIRVRPLYILTRQFCGRKEQRHKRTRRGDKLLAPDATSFIIKAP